MKRAMAVILSLALSSCILAVEDHKGGAMGPFQIAPGGAGGPAVLFKTNTLTGQIWYAWWDATEARYRWRLVEQDPEMDEVRAQEKPLEKQ